MAMNLRLPEATEEALRREATRSGESQQHIVREAVERRLGLRTPGDDKAPDELIASGVIRPPRNPYSRVEPTVELPAGTSSLELLDREDRV